MADDIDRTQDRLEIEEALRRKYKPVETTLTSSGYCLNCGEKVGPTLRWCDNYCRDDWDKRVK